MGQSKRKFTADFKARVALEALKESQTTAQITSQYKVHVSQVTKWKKQAKDGLLETFKNGTTNKQTLATDTDHLYQEIGKLQVENAFLKKSVFPAGM